MPICYVTSVIHKLEINYTDSTCLVIAPYIMLEQGGGLVRNRHGPEEQISVEGEIKEMLEETGARQHIVELWIIFT